MYVIIWVWCTYIYDIATNRIVFVINRYLIMYAIENCLIDICCVATIMTLITQLYYFLLLQWPVSRGDELATSKCVQDHMGL